MKSMIANLIDEEIFNTNYILESDADFLKRICKHIFHEVSYLKKLKPSEFNNEVTEEIEDQVLEVFKIKTYGYSSLQDYKKSHRTKSTRVG